MDIQDIKPYGKNAKKHPDKQLEQLAKVVAEIGWRQSVEVNQIGTIIVGHGRYLAWKKFKDKYKLPDVWIDVGKTVFGKHDERPLTPEQETMWRLADNKLNESEWDMGMVIDELKDLSEQMLDLTGFDRDLEDDEKDDEIPESAPAITQPGDLYELGGHRVLCGDATKRESYEKLMYEPQQVEIKGDCVFSDPPYNVNYSGSGENTSNTIMNDNMSDTNFEEFLSTAFTQMAEHSKDEASWYIFHSPLTQDHFRKAINQTLWKVKTQLIWNKPSAGLGMNEYKPKHEPFFYCTKDKANFYGDRTGTSIWDFQKSDIELMNWAKKQKKMEAEGRTTIWTMKRENVNEYVHPTQKPMELIQRAIVNSSKAGDIIMDPFLGSGSTLIASEKTGRTCYGMELDPKFVDIIIQRYVDYTDNETIIKNGQEIQWKKTIKTA